MHYITLRTHNEKCGPLGVITAGCQWCLSERRHPKTVDDQTIERGRLAHKQLVEMLDKPRSER